MRCLRLFFECWNFPREITITFLAVAECPNFFVESIAYRRCWRQKKKKKNGGKREKEIDCHHDHHFSFFHSFSRISPPGKKKKMRTHVLLPLLLMPRMVSRSLDDRRRSGQASKGLNRMMHACTYYAAWLPTAGGDGGGEQSYYYTVDRSGCTGVIK